MAIQTINLGTYANSSTGDDLRTAFEKVNANFAFLDLTSAVDAVNIGTGTGVYSSKSGDYIQLKSLVAGTDMVITGTSSEITLSSLIDITRDTAPALGGNLSLNSFNVTGTGNVNITGSMTSTGNTTIGGDVAVNGGDLTTTATTFNLVNTTATTVNFAAAANFLNIGKTTGLTTVAGELQVNDDVVITNNGRLKTSNSSAYVFNEVANYVLMGQAAIRVDIGNASGLTVFGNDIDITGDAIVRQNLTVDGSITIGTITDLIIPGGSNGYLLSTDGLGGLNWVPAFSGNYNDLSNRPTLATVATSGNYNDLSNRPTLATVATSGNYNDLSNRPSAYILPTATTSVLGGVKVDGTTITISNGVITSIGGGGGGSGSLDFGTFASPAGFTLDLGSF